MMEAHFLISLLLQFKLQTFEHKHFKSPLNGTFSVLTCFIQ